VQLFSQPAVCPAAQFAVQQKCLSLELGAALWLAALLVVELVEQCRVQLSATRFSGNGPAEGMPLIAGNWQSHSIEIFSAQGFIECMPRTQYPNRTKRFLHSKSVFSFPVQVMYLQDGRRCPCGTELVVWGGKATGKRVDDA